MYEMVNESRVTLYEISKPKTVVPWTFVLDASVADTVIFHDLVNTDAFDGENYFLGCLWDWVHGGTWEPGRLDISIAAEDEPKMFRRTAEDILYTMEQAAIAKLALDFMAKGCWGAGR